MADKIEDRGGKSLRRSDGKTEEDKTDLRNARIRKDTFEVFLTDRADRADCHRQEGADHEDRQEISGCRRIDEEHDAHDAVNADFDQDAAEHGTDRRRRCRMDIREPEMEREKSRLVSENDDEEER